MKLVTTITMIALLASSALSKSNNLDYVDVSLKKAIQINIVDPDQESRTGGLVQADESYFYFLDTAENTTELVLRSQVQLVETNMDVNLLSLLKGKNPELLTDIIELNDGTRIPSIILDISGKEVQYFTGKTLKRESISANSIYMVYIDNGTIGIPFPVADPDFAVL
ncbi:MAG: hypothetical protein HQ506_00295 [Candidatus Marinimicrobia bacterium]|nr:hypothetical protein [Candidatus Neomarinimicrobiota bacterium]